MSPLVRDVETYVRDTNHALNIINDFRFDDTMTGERFLYTMDIKSWYTVIPNNSGLEALAHFLDKRTVLEPPTSTLTRLAELVLTLNAFTFNGDFYKQTGGVAMGSKMGPNYACLFVGYIEEQIARQYTGFVPQLHKRYIDDVLGVACCSRLELDNYINFVSNFHPALQFTHTISASDISFLDINLRITNDRISTSIHYKVTDTHSYLHKQSSHPRHCKDGLPRSQLLRLRRLCSDDSDFLEKGKEMISFFVQRGYCASSLQRDLDAIQRVNRNNVIKQQDSESRDRSRIPLVLTFHPLSERIKRILVSNFNILSGDPQTKEIFPQPPLVAYRRDCNVRDTLVHTAVAHAITFLVTAPYKVPNALSTSRMHSPVNHLAWYMPSLAAVAPPSTSVKQTFAVSRKTCQDFLSQSILMPTDIPCKTHKSVGSCSAAEINYANARK